jgi:hypothetical protein
MPFANPPKSLATCSSTADDVGKLSSKHDTIGMLNPMHVAPISRFLYDLFIFIFFLWGE